MKCLDGPDECSGPVEYHSIDMRSGFPRCDKHWGRRLERREDSMEKYADSDVIPAWFDPTLAGESWFPDE